MLQISLALNTIAICPMVKTNRKIIEVFRSGARRNFSREAKPLTLKKVETLWKADGRDTFNLIINLRSAG